MKKKRKTAWKRGMRISAFALAACLYLQCGWMGSATQVVAAEETGDLNTTADTDGTFEVDGVTYREIEPGKAELTNGKGLSGNIVIPETVSSGDTEYTVVSIGNNAFYNIMTITSVEFPDTITRIGMWAFDNAFSSGCNVILTLPRNLRVIESHAFSASGLCGHLDIPDSVTRIGAYAFCENNFETITIHNPDISMDGYAFQENSQLTAVTLPQGLTSLASGTFSSCTNLAEITLPDTLREIKDNAFNGCTGLEKIALPDSLKALAVHVFEGCTSLREVIIPEGVTQLPSSCFAGCSNLTVTLPDTIKTIDPEAFKNASDSVTVNCTSRRAALAACYAGLKKIMLDGAAFEPPAETAFETSEYQFAVTDDKNLSVRLVKYKGEAVENLEIPATVTSLVSGLTYTITEIGNGAFGLQSGLTGTLRIPDTVMEIGEYCFQLCSGLTEIKLPQNLKFMGQNAFAFCESLAGTLYIPESLTAIPDQAFYTCTNLTGLVLSDSVTEIGRYAFSGCDSLSRIQIGQGLNQLGESAFPDNATLLAYYSERIWQFLAENTNRLEESSVILLWDGRTDILADAAVSVQDTVVVNGSVTIGEGVVLTIDPDASVTVDGTLINNGTITGNGKFLVNGSVDGNGTVSDSVDIWLLLATDMAETVNDSSYTGTAITPEPKVFALLCGKEIVFEKDKDFTYRYEDNISPGQAKVIITPAESGTLKGESITRTFTISKADQEAVECTLDFTLNADRKTYTAVIGEVDGAEYSFDGTAWSESNKKGNCQPGVSYTAYIRRKETATHNAGPIAQITKTTKKLEQEVPAGTAPPAWTAPPAVTAPPTATTPAAPATPSTPEAPSTPGTGTTVPGTQAPGSQTPANTVPDNVVITNVTEQADGTFTDARGEKITNSIVQTDNGTKYIAGQTGKKVTNSVVTTADGTMYCTKDDGAIAVNQTVTLDGSKYFAKPNGVVARDEFCTTKYGNTVYAKTDGTLAVNTTFTVDGSKYFAKKSAAIAKNEFCTTPSGSTVYAKADGTLAVNTVIQVSGKKYFLKKSGAIAKNAFSTTSKGSKVYSKANGVIVTGKIFKVNGKRYYAKKSGALAVKTWVTVGNKKYYCNASGQITKTRTINKIKALSPSIHKRQAN